MSDSDHVGPDGLPPLGEVVRDLGLAAHKNLGQHFIFDLNLTRRIARAAGPLHGTTVVEIGPGPGGLTRALLMEGAACVIAIERDERVRPALDAISQRYPRRLIVQFTDALKVDWPFLVVDASKRPIIVANLPYNIATLLLVRWLESEPWPPWYGRMVLMFQKEVAERIVAIPATKAYGRLAVLAQWRAKVRLQFSLRPEAFIPPPTVASAVVDFQPSSEPSPPCSVKTLSRVTGAAFGQRRKMLRQSLRSLVSDPEALLAAAGIDPTLRGEVLEVRDFARLAYVLDRWPNAPSQS
jgi:16S rRNA (adenine1518-N6/adenine1519-N6)-dimethyltransferase